MKQILAIERSMNGIKKTVNVKRRAEEDAKKFCSLLK